MNDMRGMCIDYRPWNDTPNPLNTAECFWFLGRTHGCDNPMSRYHRKGCPWDGYPKGTDAS